MSNSVLENLAEMFMKFPGIGPRQAKRFAYFLAGEDTAYVKRLGEMILEAKKEIWQCPDCFRFYGVEHGRDTDKCEVCANINRDKSLLMIVEKDVDFENIERANVYKGRYFVIGGNMSLDPDDVKGKNKKLRFRELFENVKREQYKEIILATSATVESENTARYAEKILEPLLKPLDAKITRLGRGLSTGTELEYIDSETLNNALENRK